MVAAAQGRTERAVTSPGLRALRAKHRHHAADKARHALNQRPRPEPPTAGERDLLCGCHQSYRRTNGYVITTTSPCPQHALTATPPTPRVLKLGRLVWHGPKADETPYPDDEQETL